MVHLKRIGRRNPQDIAAPERFYVQTIASGRTDLERLAYLISNQCTVRESDCLAVLSALEHNIADELGQGKIVDLGRVGSFKVSVHSAGHDISEEANVQSVKSAHLNFRPGNRLREMLERLKYELMG